MVPAMVVLLFTVFGCASAAMAIMDWRRGRMSRTLLAASLVSAAACFTVAVLAWVAPYDRGHAVFRIVLNFLLILPSVVVGWSMRKRRRAG